MHEALERVPALILDCDEDIDLSNSDAKQKYVTQAPRLFCHPFLLVFLLAPFGTHSFLFPYACVVFVTRTSYS